MSPASVSSACCRPVRSANAVAGEAHVAGSLRVFTDDMFDRAREGVRRVLDEACAATGCTYDLDFAEGYPPVDNDPDLFARIAPVLPELQLVDEPLLIAEDFAFYQRHLPGVFFLLGTGVPAGQDNPSDAEAVPLTRQTPCTPIPCSLTRKSCSKASTSTNNYLRSIRFLCQLLRIYEQMYAII